MFIKINMKDSYWQKIIYVNNNKNSNGNHLDKHKYICIQIKKKWNFTFDFIPHKNRAGIFYSKNHTPFSSTVPSENNNNSKFNSPPQIKYNILPDILFILY